MDKFLARQPIFSQQKEVFGYEILFRTGIENFFPYADPEMAARAAVDNFLLLGLDTLTRGKRAFLNCTRSFLVNDLATLLPRELVVIEVLESVTPDAEVVGACKRLKRAGYVIALDDFEDKPGWEQVVDLADIIKVDVQSTSVQQQFSLALKYGRAGIEMLAEKVETPAEFQQAFNFGYRYFQGYFLCRPEIVSTHDVPAFKLNYLHVLQMVYESEIEIERLAEVIRRETSLCYKLLRYLNSVTWGLRSPVSSIVHALSLLGEREIRKWVSVFVLADMAPEKPAEVIMISLIRARFCEALAIESNQPRTAADAFLVGLLSSLDAILDRPMADVLEQISLHAEAKAALLGRSNPLRDLLDIALFYEKGDWSSVQQQIARLNCSESRIVDCYLESVAWARHVFQH